MIVTQLFLYLEFACKLACKLMSITGKSFHFVTAPGMKNNYKSN